MYFRSAYIDGLHSRQRTDFDNENTIVRMKKWPKDISFVDHGRFVDSVTHGEMNQAKHGLFENAIHYETPFYIREMDERHKDDEKRRIE